MRIVIVNANPLCRSAYCSIIAPLAPHAEIVTVPGLATARRALAGTCGDTMVLLDVDLKSESGLAGLEALHQEFPLTRIVITAPAPLSAATLLECASRGACGYVPADARPEILGDALRAVMATEDDADAQITVATTPVETVPVPAVNELALVLTPRQIDVLALLVRGLPNKTIGRELNLAPSTVKAHISAILRSLQARSRTEAVIAAIRYGLMPAGVAVSSATGAPNGGFRESRDGRPSPYYQAEGSGRRSLMALASI